MFGRLDPHTNWCHRRVWPQTQIGSKHIALGRDIIQKCHHILGCTNKAGSGLENIHRGKIAFIKKTNQIYIRGIIQLTGAKLSHSQNEHTQFCRIRLGLAPGDFAALQLNFKRMV